jgi:hypothetical protein
MIKQHFVNYTLFGRDYQAGPYKDADEANIHRWDIKSFSGVTDCFVAFGRDERRLLIKEAA